MEQVHTCRLRRCLQVDRNGSLSCKRRAPFEVSAEDYVQESGRWSMKRLYAYLNAWNPDVTVLARCNNDIKMLTNGEQTKNITYYCTTYTGKKQQKTHSMSAIMAKAHAYHLASGDYLDDVLERQRLFLFRLVHSVNSEQELAAPMVISYLMGWGDVYASHKYTPIYLGTFIGMLRRAYPEFKRSVERSVML
ncbi:hypothetical protein K523DRAFT_251835 [Schizophyllum commune Tattone D]|nr:hypothetical protein K525DRAFT_187577 [Schizophyllum commune Loenen D]KAI5825096.1 hypothetical protein K523DRAFT_251835 [Schizophyllum commune Tattone D]